MTFKKDVDTSSCPDQPISSPKAELRDQSPIHAINLSGKRRNESTYRCLIILI